MMGTNHIRNIIALLLVLTLANLAASFMALRAVRMTREATQPRMEKIERTLDRLVTVTTSLCAQHSDVCPKS